jgi:methylmalonyl-CoA mutase N-terminal domain/subunit
MALCSYDEAYTIPTEKAALISLRTMQILQEEVGVCDTVDPLAGSYYVEALTDEMEKRIVTQMEKVDAAGGIVKAIAEGVVQAEVSRQAFEHEKALQEGKVRKVGVNCFCIDEEEPEVALHPFREEEAQRQVERLNAVRAERDAAAVAAALAKVRADAKEGTANLMPAIMDAVMAYATVGEVMGALKDVYGTFEEPIRF